MLIVSTGYDVPADAEKKCRASVAHQSLRAEHIYYDAKTSFEVPYFEFLTHTLAWVPPHEIVVSLDADDWLFCDDALEIVQREHDKGAWVTYGSFIFSDRRPGFAHKIRGPNIRMEPWSATHLKTFRAGLFHRIDPEDLRIGGEWISRAKDMAMMLPMLEMAAERAHYIDQTLYVYNYQNSDAFKQRNMAEEKRCEEYVRSRPPYARLVTL